MISKVLCSSHHDERPDLKIYAVQLALTEGHYGPRWVNNTLTMKDKQKRPMFF